jgi:hypothetical protein
VDVEEVDVGSIESLERPLNTNVHGFEAVSRELDLLGDVRVSDFRRVCILGRGQKGISPHESHVMLTLVATKIWSRIPLDFIHSPMKISDSPSWLGNEGSRHISQHLQSSRTY